VSQTKVRNSRLPHNQHKTPIPGRYPSIRMCRGRTVARMIGRILLTVAALAVTGFMLLVLIGVWDRYEQETAALGFSGIYERYLAWQAGFSVDPKGRAAEKAERARSFEQRPKLVGTSAVGSTNQGMSVALSADGNTAIVGGPGPNNSDRDRSPVVGPAGAAWVFTRSGGAWRQQGGKLVGTTSEYGGGLWSQGASVALSSDGNTAIIGGPSDNRTTGAAWVFTRSGSIWAQQGNKLIGSGASEPPLPPGQGMSSRSPPTATLPSWVAGGPRARGRSRAAAVAGRSKAKSSSAAVLWERPAKACRSHFPPTAIPPSWAGGPITARPGRHGYSPVVGGLDAARQEARRHRRCGKRLPRHVRRVVRRRQYRHRGWAWRQPVGSIGALRPWHGRRGVGVHPQWRCLDAAGR
jgi:hypothetical protein